MAKAKDLRATECFVWPLNAVDFIGTVRSALSTRVEESWKSLDALQMIALESCATTMGACFSQCRNGQDLPLTAIRDTTKKIAAAAGDTPLETWLGAIEHYHDYTFTHCMFVSFTIVAFAQAIGIKNGDLTHLTLGALLHDIGNSRVPIAILDKRSYKPGLPRQKALEIMSTMGDALDQDFVKTFAEFIMSTNQPVRMAG